MITNEITHISFSLQFPEICGIICRVKKKGGFSVTDKEKLEKAKKLLQKKYSFFRNFSKIYPFTTENIDGYIDYFNLKDKSLLTVGSSGDQVLNAIYKDCQDITLVDVCSFSKEFYELKKSAILTLTKDEYLQFFTLKKDSSFSNNLYKQIEEALVDEESYEFWNELFTTYPNRIIRERLFADDEYQVEDIQKINPYLKSKESYTEVQDKIKKVEPTFIIGDIRRTEYDRKFDNIWLSNIFDYLGRNINYETIENIRKQVNNNGKILYYYLYLISVHGEYIDKGTIHDPTRIIKKLPLDTDLYSFTGIDSIIEPNNRPNAKDGVLVYQKKRQSK